MEFQSRVRVTGMKASKGQIEGGMAFDSTKVYVEVKLDDSKGTSKGAATTEYSLGTSEEYTKFRDLVFPFDGVADFEIVTTGKVQKTILKALRPVSVRDVAPAKAP